MIAPPVTVHLDLYPYASFTEVLVLRDDAGNLVDLTGYTALMHARREVEAASTVIELDSETTPAGIVLGGAAGTIELRMTPEQTASLDVHWSGETWVYDLLLAAPSGEVRRAYQGCIVVVPGVTRPTP